MGKTWIRALRRIKKILKIKYDFLIIVTIKSYELNVIE